MGADGSAQSDLAGSVALDLADRLRPSRLIGCHVYAAEMHRQRFKDMEPDLPERFREMQRLNALRDTHQDIIGGGMEAISDAYLRDLAAKAQARNVPFQSSMPEGRNYVELMRAAGAERADLVVLGGQGHGAVQGSTVGSLTERVLLLGVGFDSLIVRNDFARAERPIVVGIDGSPEAVEALRRASLLSKALNSPIHILAIYDPYFHTGVFRKISHALDEEGQRKFNFKAQERLHDEIIDDGLSRLYGRGIELASEAVGEDVASAVRKVLPGKVWAELVKYSREVNAGLVVVGKWGLHRTNGSPIGSNTMNLLRSLSTNLLVVSSGPVTEAPTQGQDKEPALSVAAREETLDLGKRMPEGMGSRVRARSVTLHKTKRLAPSFHEHIVRSKVVGMTLKKGDKVLVFEVIACDPEGEVVVDEDTILEFR